MGGSGKGWTVIEGRKREGESWRKVEKERADADSLKTLIKERGNTVHEEFRKKVETNTDIEKN